MGQAESRWVRQREGESGSHHMGKAEQVGPAVSRWARQRTGGSGIQQVGQAVSRWVRRNDHEYDENYMNIFVFLV